MDPQTDLPDLVEDLEVNIDELTAILSPLLSNPLSTTATSLPLLDKAKLYVLAAYSIESLLYSSLSASGVNAKEHAIFRELGRLKGYFAKIKEVEERGAQAGQPKQRLDVGAATRFIKHGLAGNEKYDLERAERQAKERARAAVKAAMINKKFDDDGKEIKKNGNVTPIKRAAEEEMALDEQGEDDEEVIGGLEEPQGDALGGPLTKRSKLSKEGHKDDSAAPASEAKKKGKKSSRGRKKGKISGL